MFLIAVRPLYVSVESAIRIIGTLGKSTPEGKNLHRSQGHLSRVNESAILGQFIEMVLHSVGATLKQMLDAKADRLSHADKVKRSESC
jgi:hypothetical protein